MKYKVKTTATGKKLYPKLQQQHCHDPNSSICPCYNAGDEFVFRRDDERDDFWHMGLNISIGTNGSAGTVAGGPKVPSCSEARDVISHYTYIGLQDSLVAKGWMRKENTMIIRCLDGTGPVIFRIERVNYK